MGRRGGGMKEDVVDVVDMLLLLLDMLQHRCLWILLFFKSLQKKYDDDTLSLLGDSIVDSALIGGQEEASSRVLETLVLFLLEKEEQNDTFAVTNREGAGKR
jgi:hypothetical protein